MERDIAEPFERHRWTGAGVHVPTPYALMPFASVAVLARTQMPVSVVKTEIVLQGLAGPCLRLRPHLSPARFNN